MLKHHKYRNLRPKIKSSKSSPSTPVEAAKVRKSSTNPDHSKLRRVLSDLQANPFVALELGADAARHC
jgi:hypothetical protein